MVNDEMEEPERLLRRARDDPSGVPLEPLVAALDGENGVDRDRALGALYEVSKSHPERLVDAVPRLVAVLDSDRPMLRSKALLTTSKVGAVRPGTLVPHADAITHALADDSGTVQRSAARALEHLAAASPADVEPAVPALVEMLEEGSEPTRRRALDVLRSIAASEPSGVEVPVEPLLDVLENRYETPSDLDYDPNLATGMASSSDQMRGLRTLAEDGAERSERVRMREAAAATLATQAAADPATMADRFGPHADRVRGLLDDQNPTIRGTIVGALAYVAERDPSIVRPAEGRLLELLDEPVSISGNAIWALRFVESERAIEAIRAVVDDGDVDSRRRAIARRALADVD